jgi:PleD family two-component response regulator
MPTIAAPYPRPPLALIVSEEEWTALSVITIFSPRGYATLRALSGEQALQRMRETQIDLLVVQRHLRDMTGTELTARIRAEGHSVPIVILAHESWDRQEKLEALQAGAWDVCSMPMDAEELFLRVDTWVRSKLQGDVSTEQGLLDQETGLYNLQGLLRRVSELAASARRYRRPIACVVVTTASESDRDAEAAAQALAAILRQTGRASDTIGRLNRTEFVVMAPDTDLDGVHGMVQRLQSAVDSVPAAAQLSAPLRFGCYAVPNMREASIAPSDLLIRAAEALRADSGDPVIRFVNPTDARAN